MSDVNTKLRRVVGIGAGWAIVWLLFWTVVGLTIAAVDPDSIDPGEPVMMVVILGPMGLLSGIVFAVLLSIRDRGRTEAGFSVMRSVGSGILGCAIVQVAYLGHGDQGLAANIQVALLFSGFGGLVTMVWLVMARGWSRRSSMRPAP